MVKKTWKLCHIIKVKWLLEYVMCCVVISAVKWIDMMD